MSVILSKLGLNLILLENELENNLKEVQRWEAREREAVSKVAEAKQRLYETQKKITSVKNQIPDTSSNLYSLTY